METVLVLGASGLLGSNVLRKVVDSDDEAIGTYHTNEPATDATYHQLDINDTGQVTEVIRGAEPDLVINCAAMTDVDGCEADPARAERTNAEAPGSIARLCAEQGIPFTHVSTDYVFDGTAETPYTVESEPDPRQVYGATKLAGERAVRRNHPHPTIVRLSFVYGVHGSTNSLTGFPAWVRDRMQDDTVTPLFTDQWVTPTRAGQAADVLRDLHARGLTGTYHVACRSCVTPYEFGQRIAERMDTSSALIEEGRRSDIDSPAQRPAYTCLDVAGLESARGQAQPTLATDLDRIEAALLS